MESARNEVLDNRIAEAYEAMGGGTERTHAVQFYDDDIFLIASVGDYLASGLAVGQPVVAVTTEPHRQRLRLHLESRGFDVDRLSLRGQLTLASAEELLATFMEGSLPDADRCFAAVGALFRDHEHGIPRVTVRVFGEMVDVLCRAGNIEGAVRLEGLWNELAKAHRFSLLCGYSMSSFADDAHASSVASICEAHAHVIPTERYTGIDDNARLRKITMLHQRARALETEVERRRALESSLRDALTKAEAANRAKNQFLAVMSHELRTPLNAIGGHVQLVEMELLGPVTDRQRDALGRVQRSQRHLLGLINDVLNLARLESDHVEYISEPVPIEALLLEVTSLLEPLFSASSLTCRVEYVKDASSLVVRGDREKVHQILLNLLGNAIKFTPAGGQVIVRAAAGHPASRMAEISVSDTGIGMPIGKLDEVFEPFVQISSGPVNQRGGVGLGLSISRTLARGMGGDLVAASVAGSGSTFSLTLPKV
jgi:signal transduction histidine kinase